MKNRDRNKPCPCGSGKKFKKCCGIKKPRMKSLHIDCGKPIIINRLIPNPDGSISLISNGEIKVPKEAKWNVFYDRDNKHPKILQEIPVEPTKLKFDSNQILFEFDLLCAIDTNTKEINQQRISACVAILCKPDKAPNEYLINSNYTYIEGTDVPGSPENSAVREVIQKVIMCAPIYKKSLKIGIIWDSDYNNIQKYNARQLPLIDDFYLPDNFTLIYASADTGGEYLANRLIRYCDKEATAKLNEKAKY